jgi:hypothetical protein
VPAAPPSFSETNDCCFVIASLSQLLLRSRDDDVPRTAHGKAVSLSRGPVRHTTVTQPWLPTNCGSYSACHPPKNDNIVVNQC